MATKKFKGQKVDPSMFGGPGMNDASDLPSAPNPNREYVSYISVYSSSFNLITDPEVEDLGEDLRTALIAGVEDHLGPPLETGVVIERVVATDLGTGSVKQMNPRTRQRASSTGVEPKAIEAAIGALIMGLDLTGVVDLETIALIMEIQETPLGQNSLN